MLFLMAQFSTKAKPGLQTSIERSRAAPDSKTTARFASILSISLLTQIPTSAGYQWCRGLDFETLSTPSLATWAQPSFPLTRTRSCLTLYCPIRLIECRLILAATLIALSSTQELKRLSKFHVFGKMFRAARWGWMDCGT